MINIEAIVNGIKNISTREINFFMSALLTAGPPGPCLSKETIFYLTGKDSLCSRFSFCPFSYPGILPATINNLLIHLYNFL